MSLLCGITSTNSVLHHQLCSPLGLQKYQTPHAGFGWDRYFSSGLALDVLYDFRNVESQKIPLKNWLSRPGSPSELSAHQTPAPDPRPLARSSPGSPTEHKGHEVIHNLNRKSTFSFKVSSLLNILTSHKLKEDKEMQYFITLLEKSGCSL